MKTRTIINILLIAACTNAAYATDFLTFKRHSQSGKQKLALGILPTNDVNPARGLRLGVRVDDGEMQTIDARQGYVDTFNEYTKENNPDNEHPSYHGKE